MSDKPQSGITRLFNFLWAAVSVLLKLVTIVSVIASIAIAWFMFGGSKTVELEPNTPLILAPSGELVDQLDEDPSQRLLERFNGMPPSQSSLRAMIEALDAAKDDARIPFAVLKLDGLSGAGLPQLDELIAAMQAFRKAGKKIVAWSPSYDQSMYYAAAQADEIVLDPFGSIEIEGFSNYDNYFKDALDKLGVDVHVFRVGEYKSAVEPFTRSNMSPEARAANLEWLGDLWSLYGKQVGTGRQLATTVADDYVKRLADGMERLHGDTAAYAKEAGLVTSVETLSEFRKRMAAIVGFDDDLGSFRQVHYMEYLAAIAPQLRKRAAGKSTVALVVVQGEIVDGGGEIGQAGGDAVAEMLDQARRDDEVSAVVLRVNSPGGSVWASEQIRRAVNNLKADGKPVVASMSTVAASGGYWISMDADRIFAHDTTVTGSIGIFGLIPTVDRALAKYGITSDGVGTTPLAGSLRFDRPLPAEYGRIIQAQVDKGYRDFVGGVASARKMPFDKVDSIARGRVWSGTRAKTLGLVDEIGGLQQAAAAAAQLAGIKGDAYELRQMKPQLQFAQELLQRFSGSTQIRQLFGSALPAPLAQWLQHQAERGSAGPLLSSFSDPRGVYARCFCTPDLGTRAH